MSLFKGGEPERGDVAVLRDVARLLALGSEHRPTREAGFMRTIRTRLMGRRNTSEDRGRLNIQR